MIRVIFLFTLNIAFVFSAVTQNSPSQLFQTFEEAIGYIDSIQNIPQMIKAPIVDMPKKTVSQTPVSKPIALIGGANKLRTICSTPGFVTPEVYGRDKLMHTFNTGEEIRYKHSPSDSVFYLRLSNFSLERIRDNILEDKKRFLVSSDFIASNSNKRLTNLVGASRLEYSVVNYRSYPLYIVMQANQGESVYKCELTMLQKGGSTLEKYVPSIANSNDFDFIYKIYTR